MMRSICDLSARYHPQLMLADDYFSGYEREAGERNILFACAGYSIVDRKNTLLFGSGAAFVLTEEKLIVGGASGNLMAIESFPLYMVKSVRIAKQNMIYGNQLVAEMLSGEEYWLVMMDPSGAGRAVKDMKECLEKLQAVSESRATLAEEIRALKQLQDEGIISADEFELGKKKLLGER